MNGQRTILGAALVLALISASPAQRRSEVPAPRRINPTHERIKTQADQAYQQGEYAKSAQLASAVLAQNPVDHVAYYLRASARVELGRIQADPKLIRQGISDAHEALRTSGSKDVNYYLPYLYGMTGLAQLEGKKEHAAVAVNVVTPVLKQSDLKEEDRANLTYQRAMAHVFLESYAEAAADFQKAISLVPLHLGAHIGLADTYAAAGEHEKALAAFNNAVEAFPSNALVHNNKGMYLQQHGELERAVVAFTKAVEVDPNYVVAHTNRGFVLMESGELQAAEGDFTQSLKLQADQPLVHSLRGTCHLKQGELDAAIRDYTRVVQLDSRNAVARADLGFARFFNGDYAEALRSFNAAVTMDSQMRFLDPWRYLAMVESGQAGAARDKFAASLAKKQDERGWVDHVLVYLMDGIDAKTLLASVEQKDEETGRAQTCEAHFFIARKLERGDQKQQAQQHYQQAVDTGEKQLSAYRGAKLALGEAAAQSAEVPGKTVE